MSSSPLLRRIETIVPRRAEGFGGKAKNLAALARAGFPVPATRYFKEFAFVEVQDTHVALPGTGTIRRWKREAPPGFVFSLLAPKEIGQEGYREGKVTESALKSLTEVAKELDATMELTASPKKLGERLVDANLLSPHAISIVMAEQQGIRLGKIVTVEGDIIHKRLGSLSRRDVGSSVANIFFSA